MNTTIGIVSNEQLTIAARIRVSRLGHFPFNLPEELSGSLQFHCGPKFLKNVDGAQYFGPCLFEPVLFVPQPSLQLHHDPGGMCD
jgi:hypothetical protein